MSRYNQAAWGFCGVLVVLALIFTGHSAVAQAQPDSQVDISFVDAYLQREVATHRLPGLAAAIVDGENVLWSQGYGIARAGQAMTPQTQLYIGSVSKSFTALAIMQLVEQGKLDVDAPVQRYLPEFRVADASVSAQITVRHLLSHTSGLGPAGDPSATIRFPSLTEQARALQRVRPTAATGTKFQYYSQNYRLLGLLIERVSGQSYGEYLREHILSPLGMTRTVTNPADAPDLAQGHGQVFGLPVPRSQSFSPGSLPSGFIISTAEDLGHYIVALLNAGQYGSQQIVQPDTLRHMWTPPSGIETEYGMGWLSAQWQDGTPLIFHAGALENFHAEILLLPQHERGFAILVNQNSLAQQMLVQGHIWRGLAQLLTGGPAPAEPWLEWMYPAFALAVGAGLAIGLFLIWRLAQWRRRIAQSSGWMRRLRIWGDLLIVAGIAILPRLAAKCGGVSGGWADVFGLQPDAAGALLAGTMLLFARGLGKIVIVAREI